MTLSTLTTKGQVTIPKVIRERLHLAAGDKIDFVLTDAGEAVLKPVSNQIDSIVGVIRTTRQATPEEMNEAISRRMQNRS